MRRKPGGQLVTARLGGEGADSSWQYPVMNIARVNVAKAAAAAAAAARGMGVTKATRAHGPSGV